MVGNIDGFGGKLVLVKGDVASDFHKCKESPQAESDKVSQDIVSR